MMNFMTYFQLALFALLHSFNRQNKDDSIDAKYDSNNKYQNSLAKKNLAVDPFDEFGLVAQWPGERS